jgi:hypothetical protein
MLLLVVCALISILALTGCCRWVCDPRCGECPPPCPEPDATVHELCIKPALEDECTVEPLGQLTVAAGDYVEWTNTTADDVELTFFANPDLFGVTTATVFANGGTLRLQVLDAAAGQEFDYGLDCWDITPPPTLIVCPPGKNPPDCT